MSRGKRQCFKVTVWISFSLLSGSMGGSRSELKGLKIVIWGLTTFYVIIFVTHLKKSNNSH